MSFSAALRPRRLEEKAPSTALRAIPLPRKTRGRRRGALSKKQNALALRRRADDGAKRSSLLVLSP